MDNHLNNGESEVIVIIDDDNNKSVPLKKERRHKIQIDPVDKERLIITQTVKKRKRKLSVNLKDIKYEKIENSPILLEEESKLNNEVLSRDVILERVPPRCMRKGCQAAITTKCCNRQTKKKKKKSKTAPKPYFPSTTSNRTLLSPISSADLSDELSDISYDRISSDTFIGSDSDLDKLIKRTKNRDNRENKSFESNLTQDEIQESFTEISYQEYNDNTSIHSQATLVLEPLLDLYSPTNPTRSPQGNSPTYKDSNDSTNNNSINVKQEPYDSKSSLGHSIAMPTQMLCLKSEPYSSIIDFLTA